MQRFIKNTVTNSHIFSKINIRKLSTATVPPPKLFDYHTITSNLKPSLQIIESVEHAFAKLSQGLVDVPLPMHIGMNERFIYLMRYLCYIIHRYS